MANSNKGSAVALESVNTPAVAAITLKIMNKNLGVHQGRVTWEEVYAGWKSDRFQYYWEGHRREVVEREPSTEYRG